VPAKRTGNPPGMVSAKRSIASGPIYIRVVRCTARSRELAAGDAVRLGFVHFLS
jgi:hypothetical protein